MINLTKLRENLEAFDGMVDRNEPYAPAYVVLELLDRLEKAEAERDRFRHHEKCVLNYCKGHLDFMWAATIVSVIKECDFRDARDALAGSGEE